MSAKAQSKAITSEFTEQRFGEELKRKSMAYYLVFRIIIETDMPFSTITKQTVADVKGKTALTYTSHAGGIRKAPISDSLQKDISEYCEGKKQEDVFLTGKLNGNPLHVMTISQAFSSASKALKLDPPVSVRSCHKTFIYHMLLTDKNTTRARTYLHANSEREIYDFIGVPLPDRKGKNPNITRADLIQTGIVNTVSDKVNATLYAIERSLRGETELPPEDCAAIKEFCEKLDTAVTEYRFRQNE